jgi:hypothetical protein
VDSGVFYFIAGGMLINMIFMSVARPAAQPAYGTGMNQPVGIPYTPGTAEPHSGSQMIAAYFISVLAGLGGVLYLLREYGTRP